MGTSNRQLEFVCPIQLLTFYSKKTNTATDWSSVNFVIPRRREVECVESLLRVWSVEKDRLPFQLFLQALSLHGANPDATCKEHVG